MEFGPRALGSRSILADPRRKDMKDTLNARVKFREPFRPFCPSIMAEATGEYFETDYPSPFMVQAYKIRAGQRVQVLHVGTGTEAAAGTGDDDDSHRVVHLRLDEELRHVALERHGLAVEAIGLVHGDDGDARIVDRDLEAAVAAF